jgi:hypothetical protein
MGIASSTYNYSGFGIIKPNDGYLLVQGNTTTGGGNLILTSGLNDIVFAPGGSNANNEFGRMTAANTFVIKSTVSSTNTTSGAVQVAGGVGIGGTLYSSEHYIIHDTSDNDLTYPSHYDAGLFIQNTYATITGITMSNVNNQKILLVNSSGTFYLTQATGVGGVDPFLNTSLFVAI